ncbi:MAG: hypothetical protein WDW38_007515 [Sanguina aurantia]
MSAVMGAIARHRAAPLAVRRAARCRSPAATRPRRAASVIASRARALARIRAGMDLIAMRAPCVIAPRSIGARIRARADHRAARMVARVARARRAARARSSRAIGAPRRASRDAARARRARAIAHARARSARAARAARARDGVAARRARARSARWRGARRGFGMRGRTRCVSAATCSRLKAAARSFIAARPSDDRAHRAR